MYYLKKKFITLKISQTGIGEDTIGVNEFNQNHKMVHFKDHIKIPKIKKTIYCISSDHKPFNYIQSTTCIFMCLKKAFQRRINALNNPLSDDSRVHQQLMPVGNVEKTLLKM